jgi:hypothetical protein
MAKWDLFLLFLLCSHTGKSTEIIHYINSQKKCYVIVSIDTQNHPAFINVRKIFKESFVGGAVQLFK